MLTDVDDPEQAVRQLIDLANRGGGPDNITCVVADVVDLERQPPTGGPGHAVGAAANAAPPEPPGGGPGANTTAADTPAGRAAQLRETRPQPPVAVDEMPPPHAAMPRNEPMGAPPVPMQAAPRRGGGARRWTWLVVVAGVVVIGVVAGGFVLVQNVRNGYYVGAEDGRVVLFRGTTQKVPLISLSRKAAAKDQPKQPILVADLPQDLQQQVKDTYTVDGPKALKQLEDAVCKYSLVEENGKVAILKGKGQQNCKQATVKATDVPVAELPASDVDAVAKGSLVFIGQSAAEAKLNELNTRRNECKQRNSTIKDCPSSGELVDALHRGTDQGAPAVPAPQRGLAGTARLRDDPDAVGVRGSGAGP